ncbi:MAG: tetratricopeptide repeat protein [Coleofasciculaceae cyanobacterium]
MSKIQQSKQEGGFPGEWCLTLERSDRTSSTQTQYQQALDYYQQAVAIREKLSDCADKSLSLFGNKGATLFFNTGLVSQQVGEYQQALDYFEKALAIYQEYGEPEEQWATLNRMGVVYRKLGEYQQALNYFQQALLDIDLA